MMTMKFRKLMGCSSASVNASKKKVTLALTLTLFVNAVHCQLTTYAQLRAKYANENAVFVTRKENADIKMENDVPVIYTHVYEELLLLTDKPEAYMEREVYWEDFSSIKDLDAHSEIPDGNKFKTLKIKDFTRTNEISDGTFFDNERAYRFVYPGLTSGSREVLSYTEKITDPHLYGRFLFSSYVPVEDEEYSITVPSDVKIKYKLFNIKDSALDFSVKENGKNTVYTWKMHGANKIREEDDAPAISYFTPHLIVLIDSYNDKGVEKKVMSDPAALYDWYYNMVKDVNKEISPSVKKITDSITAGATSNLEKVQRIFYWVENNINYVAYEDSLGGYVPREAAKVCSRRFGDCKDMASTLVEMIRAAGLEAYQTWIGTRDIPYAFNDVPSPMATNHMICTYIDSGKKYFLDATGKDAPFGFYTSMIQGKEALIGKGPGDFEIATIPAMDTNMTEYIDSTRLTININPQPAAISLTGTGYLIASGYDKINTGFRLQNLEKKDKHDLLEGLLQKGNNTFRLDTTYFDNLNNRDKDLGIHYKFGISNYVEQNGKDLYVNPQLEKELLNDLIKPDRQAPREFDYKFVNRSVNEIEIPDGYAVSNLPQNSSFSEPKFGFKISYTVKNNIVICQDYIYINTLMLYPEDFTRWNEFIHCLAGAYNKMITFSPN